MLIDPHPFAAKKVMTVGGRQMAYIDEGEGDASVSLGFDWANQHRARVQGIAYMEGIVTPLTWTDWPEAARRVFQGFRSPAGEEMVLEKNVFVEEGPTVLDHQDSDR